MAAVISKFVVRQIFFNALLIVMSDSTENLEKAQKSQKRVGAAESDPETSGPTENLREEAAEAVDEEEDSAEPA